MRIDSGIVLAGGRGVRLGAGIPKALVKLDGIALLDRAIHTLVGCCDEVIVVAPRGIELGTLASRPERDTLTDSSRPARRVFDGDGCEGPFSGLVAGLEACGGSTVAVLGVDFPLVTPALLEALFGAFEPGDDAVVARPGRIAQPLVSLMRVALAPRLRAALQSGVRSLRGGLDGLAVRWLDDAAIARLPGGCEALLNVNTPEDLAAARVALAQRGQGAS